MNILREIVDFSVAVLGALKRRRKITPAEDGSDGRTKVNLGCGLSVAAGWLNIDGSLNAMVAAWPEYFHKIFYRLSGASQYYSMERYCAVLGNHRFLHHDLSLSLPLHPCTVDYIYSSHFFEHLFKDDAARLLSECAIALRPGGMIRISVPDLAYAVSLYGLDRKTEMLEDYFFVVSKGSYLSRHKYMYDFGLMKSALEMAGFSNVVRCDYRKGQVPDIAILDVYPEISLFVEATRQ